MLEHFRLPGMVTVAAIALSAILFKEFLKKREGQTVVEGSADNDSATESGTVESAAHTSTSPQVNKAATFSGDDYEVFLSFRGPDTRTNFTDFLHTSLTDAGIRTFKDDEDLRKGEEFAPELLQAIKQSKISIPIFSKDYASSAWCLKEVVQMVECQKTKEQKIIPIFYDVAPSEVRHQTGSYGEAFLSHKNKKRYDENTMHEWKAALKKVSFLNGWDLHEMPNRREGQFARELTQKIFTELKKAYLVVSDHLVGVNSHVNAIMEKIGAQTRETRIIGIHGMGGIGKTTIAKIIYNKLSCDFKNCCFLPDIRETSKVKGIPYLQNQLISGVLRMKCINIEHIDEGTQEIKNRLSNKRVLLLLDDVEIYNDMHALVGKGDWLGEGSKLIITSRNKNVLNVPQVDWSYEVSTMDLDQSLILFSKHAFGRDYPLDKYIVQSKKAIKIAGGLPLALEVMGSLLFITKKEMWDDMLEKWANVLPADVKGKLKISYDALEETDQIIFLDIACLFIGYDKDILIHFWDELKLFPKVAMEVLQNMSLIKIKENNEVWMHDQIRDLGRMLVSKRKIEEQTRVWNPKEALNLLRRHKGEKKVEALRLKFDHEMEYYFAYKDFESLSKLMFLEVGGWNGNFHAEESLLWHKSPSNVLPTNSSQKNSVLLPHLLWLSWHDIPTTFDITNFSMEIVVILDLSRSQVTNDWKGWSHMKVMKNLKVLNLTHCQCLKRTPNFFARARLEHLILRRCRQLVEIDGSICQLKCLVSLDISGCDQLRRLPDELGRLEVLEELWIDNTPVENIPNCQEMRNLSIFTVSFCRFATLPPTIGDLANLKYLSLKNCSLLKRLPDSIGNLQSLIELDLSVTGIKELPDSIGNLKSLKLFKMNLLSKCKIPESFWTIGELEEVDVVGVGHMNIGDCISRNQSLRKLKLLSVEIFAVPQLPESLVILELDTLRMKTYPDLANLTNLKKLSLTFSRGESNRKSDEPGEEGPMPWRIGNLTKLEYLILKSPYATSLPADINLLPRLESLELRGSNLRSLPRLPSSLSKLIVEIFKLRVLMGHSESCFSMEDLSNLQKLSTLHIFGASISEIPGLDRLENLQQLMLLELQQLEILPDLSNLNKLRHLRVLHCNELVEIQGELPESLEVLEIGACKSLQKLPDQSRLKGLRRVGISGCGKLNVGEIFWDVR